MKEKFILIDRVTGRPIGEEIDEVNEPDQETEIIGEVVASIPPAFQVADRSWDEPILIDETDL